MSHISLGLAPHSKEKPRIYEWNRYTAVHRLLMAIVGWMRRLQCSICERGLHHCSMGLWMGVESFFHRPACPVFRRPGSCLFLLPIASKPAICNGQLDVGRDILSLVKSLDISWCIDYLFVKASIRWPDNSFE